MKRPARIHVFGASGTGTTSVGAALARKLDIMHLDVDDYYWRRSDPPFQSKREPAKRVRAIRAAIGANDEWILSGSIASWGDAFVGEFTFSVFIELESVERMSRLRKREQKLYGARIAPGGDMHADHVAFLNWVQGYDTAARGIRCRPVHMQWMAKLHCPVVAVNAANSVRDLVMELTRATA